MFGVSLAGLFVAALASPAAAAPFVEFHKTAGSPTIEAGDVASFTISAQNTGDAAANNVVISDVLPNGGLAWAENPDVAQCSIVDDPGGDVLTCTLASLGVGQSFSVTVEATTDSEACDYVLTNTATLAVEGIARKSATASISVTCPPREGDEGCTPGFWKNHPELWDGVGADDVTSTVQTTDGFNATFGVTSAQSGLADSVTLLNAVNLGGGGLKALNRHAAAATASADSGIDYEFSLAGVIALYRDAVGADPGPETIASALAKLSTANERGCPLT